MGRHLIASLGLAAALVRDVAGCDVGPTPWLAPASVPPASIAPASSAPASTSPAGGDAVKIAGFAFAPVALTVKVGATVTWTNTDTATHTVVWDDGSQGSGSLTSGGAPYTRTFATAGTFAYHCGIHSSMTGTIVVQP